MLLVLQPWRSRSRLNCVTRQLSVNFTSRKLVTLAIESSCDDTSVAILERNYPRKPFPSHQNGVCIHFHEKITAKNKAYGGIHPIVSLESHQSNLAKLVNRALQHLPGCNGRTFGVGSCRQEWDENTTSQDNDGVSPSARFPDLVCVTRGPGMRSNLSVGLDFAKGLSVAWQRPLVGVHHMQAHTLTPRLVSVLHTIEQDHIKPDFPFLSLLVSGGHTLLLHSRSLIAHTILATTTDIAIGDAIDKIARAILPPTIIAESTSTMFGPLLERFAFPNSSEDYRNYEAPKTREQELMRQMTKWGWGFAPPLGATKSGSRVKSMEYSFSGLCSAAIRFTEERGAGKEKRADISDEERRDLAREAMRVAFEHLASRVVIGLNNMKETDRDLVEKIKSLVVSGGVAANSFLKKVLRSFLDTRGYGHVELVFPPAELCTDNAAMIGWAGIEMFEAGFETDLDCHALRKWSIDPNAEDGGILGVGGWRETSTYLRTQTKM